MRNPCAGEDGLAGLRGVRARRAQIACDHRYAEELLDINWRGAEPRHQRGGFLLAERRVVIHHKRGGSDAGNRGVRSIAEALGTPDFIRIRIGVSHPGEAGQAINHVLKPLTQEQLSLIQAVLDRVTDAVASLLADGLDRAMSLYNQRV